MAMLDCRNIRPNEKVVDLFPRIANIGPRAHYKFDPIWVIKFGAIPMLSLSDLTLMAYCLG